MVLTIQNEQTYCIHARFWQVHARITTVYSRKELRKPAEDLKVPINVFGESCEPVVTTNETP